MNKLDTDQFRISRKLLATIRALAAREGRTIRAQAERVIIAGLKAQKGAK